MGQLSWGSRVTETPLLTQPRGRRSERCPMCLQGSLGTHADARVSSEAHSMPAAQLCFQCPAPGTAVILGSIKATPKILSAPLLWLALSAFRHLTSRLA